MQMLNREDLIDPLTDKHLVDKTFLHGYSYYHGMIPMEDVPDLLEKDGDFLLRKELINDELLIAAISVRCGDDVKHFMINQSPDGDFYIERVRARTIEELVQKHLQRSEPLSKASQAILKRPIPRQEWMLNHEDIVFKETLKDFTMLSDRWTSCVVDKEDSYLQNQNVGNQRGMMDDVFPERTTDISSRLPCGVLKKGLGKHYNVEEFEGELVQNNITRPVFLKTIGISSSRDARSHLMREARLLRSLRHENVGEIYGIALHYSPIILVLEYFSTSLFTHLRRNVGRISPRDKRRFVCEAAAGLSYLAQSNCIHRDIAARNCKLSDSLHVKISGFTLCEHPGEDFDSSTMQIAVKWQAPEVLKDRKYTLKTDVWSFGILMWEVYSEGAEPYAGMSPSAVKELILKDDYRMPIPKDCPKLLARIMASCWDSYPPRRPCMQAIHLVIRDG